MQVVIHPIDNFGDLLNVPLLNYYFEDSLDFVSCKEAGTGKVLMGLGTLIDYIIPLEWFENREVVFLGTGSARPERHFTGAAGGFVRGKLTEAKMGVKGLGDLGILIDRIYGFPTHKRKQTGMVIDKSGEDNLVVKTNLPEPKMLTAYCKNVMQVRDLYDALAECDFIITDRLHVATTAEAIETPWLLWNHRRGDLIQTPDKFLDWAGMIGKERFVVDDLANVNIIYENTDFQRSKEQKQVLEDTLRTIKRRKN